MAVYFVRQGFKVERDLRSDTEESDFDARTMEALDPHRDGADARVSLPPAPIRCSGAAADAMAQAGRVASRGS